MKTLLQAYAATATRLDKAGDVLLPVLARAFFAAVLLTYFWASALTKLDGPFQPTLGGFAQIFPKAFEAVGYDASQMGLFPRLVVILGAWAELVLPALIVLGLFTRLAALGMVGFVVVQSLTDIWGHGAAAGAWFDRASDALILDQRALWILLLIVLIAKGGGAISADRALRTSFNRLAT